MAKKPEKAVKNITIRGLVVPSDWDDRDEVCAVTICSDDEERYEIVDRKMVRLLMKHMDEEVEAVGHPAEDEYGEEVFEVVSFEVIPLDDDEEWDEEDEDEDEDEDDDDEDDDDWDDR